MPTIDLDDPKARADAIAGGYIWSAPRGAIEAACQDIASGRVPAPGYIPDEWVAYIRKISGKTIRPAYTEGRGPA